MLFRFNCYIIASLFFLLLHRRSKLFEYGILLKGKCIRSIFLLFVYPVERAGIKTDGLMVYNQHLLYEKIAIRLFYFSIVFVWIWTIF